MKPTPRPGLFLDRGFLWTQNRQPGQTVYGERLRDHRGQEYRNWNPYRSKMAAYAKVSGAGPWPDLGRDIVYLGASSGTTVSHMSDMLAPGAALYAVEFSPRSVRDLLWNMATRDNVVPILEDAHYPERYAPYMDRPAGTLIQDVAQRDQVGIFLRNLPLLAEDGLGFLFVKARSIHVARDPRDIFRDVAGRLQEAGLKIHDQRDLDPFEKDHRAFIVGRPT